MSGELQVSASSDDGADESECDEEQEEDFEDEEEDDSECGEDEDCAEAVEECGWLRSRGWDGEGLVIHGWYFVFCALWMDWIDGYFELIWEMRIVKFT